MTEIKKEAKFWEMSKELSHDTAGRGNSVYKSMKTVYWEAVNYIMGVWSV